MRGDLSIDEPIGQRWDLALDLIERGGAFVVLAGRLIVFRDVVGPRSDGHVHIHVLAGQGTAPSHAIAQDQVDAARAFISDVASEDQRFNQLLQRFGSVWEYVGYDGSASWLLADIAEDGSLVWDRP